MKRIHCFFLGVSFSFILCGSLLIGLGGCTTSQQTTAFKTLGTLEDTTTAAVDQYYAGVIKGTFTTNAMPQVSKAYNDFQAAMTLAVGLVQNNTNALAPANLVQESTDLINLVNKATGH